MSGAGGVIKNRLLITLISLFAILTAWRIVILFLPFAGDVNERALVWGTTYQVVALWGAICGIYYSRHWGGFKSVIGRASLAFSCGLLAQVFGQSVYSYYFYKGAEVLYPSLGDVGFFGSIPFYIYGVVLLGQASRANVSLKSYSKQVSALIFPLLMLAISYYFFLREYQFDWSQAIKTLLDFGYPLGQALYVSIAVLVFILSRKILGGMLRTPTLLFLIALVVQYSSDFTFLYQSSRGTYVAGGIVDYMYLVSYFLMALSLIVLGHTYQRIVTEN